MSVVCNSAAEENLVKATISEMRSLKRSTIPLVLGRDKAVLDAELRNACLPEACFPAQVD